jgi:N-acetylmuramoyl-L-alanine amidase
MKFVDRPSPNFDARAASIDLVVLHYTGMQDAETALRRLTDPAPKAGHYKGPWQAEDVDPETALGRASAHYVVGEDGTVFRLVDETNRAWHAGAGAWEGRDDVNSRSVGIEIVNGGHDFGLPPFPDLQIEAVIALVRSIMDRWELGPHRVVGHSDVAPERKNDPGERFPWKRLAAAGVSLWPDAGGDNRLLCKPGDRGERVHALHASLAAFGYAVPDSDEPAAAVFDAATEAAVRAFQRRFMSDRIDGVVRTELMEALDDLLEQIAEFEDD